MRRTRLFTAVVIALLFAPVQAVASDGFSGRLLIGTHSVGIGCGTAIPCVLARHGYDGISMSTRFFSESHDGKFFTLTAVGQGPPLPPGAGFVNPDVDVCFFDETFAGDGVDFSITGCFNAFGDESGLVPPGSVGFNVLLFTGVDVTWTFTV